MEDIKELIGMLERLPSLALWVIAAFWAYKVIFIGSIYGVIRLGINRVFEWKTTPKDSLVNVRAMIDGVCIKECLEPLLEQIKRLKGINIHALDDSLGVGTYNNNARVIYTSDVMWLREAIDEKLDREKEREREKNEKVRN